MTQPPDDKLQRRTFLTLTLGWCSALFALGASLAAAGRFLVPNVLYEPNSRFKGLKPEDYAEGPTFLPDLRVFLFREGKKLPRRVGGVHASGLHRQPCRQGLSLSLPRQRVHPERRRGQRAGPVRRWRGSS
jgi:hypothetical protein